jgi:hypothetical protein
MTVTAGGRKQQVKGNGTIKVRLKSQEKSKTSHFGEVLQVPEHVNSVSEESETHTAACSAPNLRNTQLLISASTASRPKPW